ncbi:hypothetical protein BH11PSE14_BH11PSE14_13680 [soil metagenome]
MNNVEDRQVGEAARSRFEHAVQSLPAPTANRLRLARRAALSGPRASAGIGRWVLPLGATAALVLALAWWQQAPEQASAGTTVASRAAAAVPGETTGIAGIAAPVVVASQDDVDLYAWLADTPVAVDASRGGSL